jgi:hypothetical protein
LNRFRGNFQLEKLSFGDDDQEFDWMQMAPDAVRIINRAPGVTVLGETLQGTILPKVQSHDVVLSIVSQMGTPQVQRKRKILPVSSIEDEDIAEKKTPDQVRSTLQGCR